jgi:hypothetical protein
VWFILQGFPPLFKCWKPVEHLCINKDNHLHKPFAFLCTLLWQFFLIYSKTLSQLFAPWCKVWHSPLTHS